MEIKERILKGAEELFFRFGIKSVTMDEIARQLSISKKTIYQFFKDKNELVSSVMVFNLAKQETAMEEIGTLSKDPVDEVLKISDYIKKTFQTLHPSVLFDIQKFHAEAWDLYCQHNEKCFQLSIVGNLKRGIELGYYRSEIDVEIISKLRMAEINIGYDPFVYPPNRFDLTKVQIQFIEHFLYGICTLKGHKLINKYKQINEEE